jgi:hypothetical protein
MEKQLRAAIFEQLKTVNQKNAPFVFEMIQNEQGYKNIEERIIVKMVNQNLSISASIGQIEQELSDE